MENPWKSIYKPSINIINEFFGGTPRSPSLGNIRTKPSADLSCIALPTWMANEEHDTHWFFRIRMVETCKHNNPSRDDSIIPLYAKFRSYVERCMKMDWGIVYCSDSSSIWSVTSPALVALGHAAWPAKPHLIGVTALHGCEKYLPLAVVAPGHGPLWSRWCNLRACHDHWIHVTVKHSWSIHLIDIHVPMIAHVNNAGKMRANPTSMGCFGKHGVVNPSTP